MRFANNTNDNNSRTQWPAGGRGAAGGPDSNLDRLLIVAAVAAFLFFVSSFAPPAIMPMVLAHLVFIASLISVAMALVLDESPRERRITHFDEAAIFSALSLLATVFGVSS